MKDYLSRKDDAANGHRRRRLLRAYDLPQENYKQCTIRKLF